MPQIFQTLVAIEGSGKVFKMDTISHNGRMWLVPEWIDMASEGWSAPARIICLDTLQHQKVASGEPAHFVLNAPLPKSVLEGQASPESTSQFVVIDRPDIKLTSGGRVH